MVSILAIWSFIGVNFFWTELDSDLYLTNSTVLVQYFIRIFWKSKQVAWKQKMKRGGASKGADALCVNT